MKKELFVIGSLLMTSLSAFAVDCPEAERAEENLLYRIIDVKADGKLSNSNATTLQLATFGLESSRNAGADCSMQLSNVQAINDTLDQLLR